MKLALNYDAAAVLLNAENPSISDLCRVTSRDKTQQKEKPERCKRKAHFVARGGFDPPTSGL